MRASTILRAAALALFALLLSGCGYNQIQAKDEAVAAGWSEVLNQYKRRADLLPNLERTVQRYASHERDVLTAVTEARAKVSQITVNADDAQSLAQYQAAQGELTQALGRLLVVSENYPDLKADATFLNLQTQLEGTENRIAVARNRYIDLVRDYNTYLRKFPVNLTAKMFGYQVKPTFRVENEAQIQDAPALFQDPAPSAQPAAPATQPAPAPGG